MRRRVPVVFAVLVAAACDPGPSNPPSDGGDEGLDGQQLTGQGPGGIDGITGGMAKADPQIVEAEALLAQGKAEQALERMDAAIAEQPEHARFHYVRGNALSYLERNDDARAAFERAIELDETDALPHAALGNLVGLRVESTRADKEAAIEHYQRALHLDPELGPAHLSLGVVLLDLGRFQEAIEALENADRLAGNVDTAYTLAQAHARLGNDEAALKHAESALEYEPNASGADIRLLYARLLMKAGRDDDAAREFEQVAKLVPDSPPLRLEVARGLLELGLPDAALPHVQWVLEAAPGKAPVLVNYGRVLAGQGKPEQAVEQFDAALAIDPSSQAARVYRVEALVASKQCKKAKQAVADLSQHLGYDGKADPAPRAVIKARGFLAAGKCK